MRPRLVSLSLSVFAAGLVLGGTATSSASGPATSAPRVQHEVVPYVGPTAEPVLGDPLLAPFGPAFGSR